MAITILGWLMIAVFMFCVMTKKLSPLVALCTVPMVFAFLVLIVSGNIDKWTLIGDWVMNGLGTTANTGILLLFAILYFSIMLDAGLFDPITKKMIEFAKGDPMKVLIATAVVAAAISLNGDGTTTTLVCCAAFLPIYEKLGMKKMNLAVLVILQNTVMNLLPWGGPTMRSATVLGIEANDLWIKLMPMQAVGIVIALATAFIWGNIEKRRGAGINSTLVVDYGDSDEAAVSEEQKNELARPQFFWFNVVLTLVVIVALVFLPVPSYFTFMIGCVIALFVNYPGAKLQNKIIKSHSSAGLMMASTILAAGVFLGVLEESEIMNHMANVLASFIPASMGRFLPLIIGVLSVPLTLLFCTDSYFYGLLPVLIGVGDAFGVDPVHTAITMVVCRNCATFISPVVPATFLGVGLAGVEIKDHIKNSFFWIWGVSIICLISGVLLGVLAL